MAKRPRVNHFEVDPASHCGGRLLPLGVRVERIWRTIGWVCGKCGRRGIRDLDDLRRLVEGSPMSEMPKLEPWTR